MTSQMKNMKLTQLQPIFNHKIRELNLKIQKGLIGEFDSTDWSHSDALKRAQNELNLRSQETSVNKTFTAQSINESHLENRRS